MAGPLQGVRVIDLTAVLMGPYASQILGDLGADVIKVESPLGDTTRQIGPQPGEGMGPIFLHINRNKRSIVLDLKQPEGMAALKRLIVDADVLMYNLRPKTMAKLGLGYEAVAEVNPKIIYVGAFGFDQRGPYAHKPAYDDLIQGAVGVPTLQARASGAEPRYVPANIADRTVALRMANAICAALFCRERNGVGQAIEIPMFETVVEYVAGDHLAGLTYDPNLGRSGYSRLMARERKPYATKDGYICAVVYNNKHWQNFLQLVGRSDLFTDDPRFASMASRTQYINEVYGFLAEQLATRTTAEWVELLEQADIPVMPLNSIDSLEENPQLKAIGFFGEMDHPTVGKIRTMGIPERWSHTKPEIVRHAPEHGEHTEEVLRELGYARAEIDALLKAGACRQYAASGALSEQDLPEKEAV